MEEEHQGHKLVLIWNARVAGGGLQVEVAGVAHCATILAPAFMALQSRNINKAVPEGANEQ